MAANHLASARLLCPIQFPAPEIEAAIERLLKDIQKCPAERRLTPCRSDDPLLIAGKKLELAEIFREPVKVELDLVHLCQLFLPIAAQAPFIAYQLLSSEQTEWTNADRSLQGSGTKLLKGKLDTLRTFLSLAGIARLAERQAHEYAKFRKSGKKPIWCHQAVANRLSDALMNAMLAEFCTLKFAHDVTSQTDAASEHAALSRLVSYSTAKAVHSYQLVMAGHGYLKSAAPSLLHQAALHFGQELRLVGPAREAHESEDGVEHAQRRPVSL